ncbi:RING-type domain-containing protein [Lamellibrachia satsuma]|nr:RING-type domain-containing protein [Lamellibrachia satsuma]
MDNTDSDTDRHQNMSAMLLSGPCLATALPVPAAGSSTKTSTVLSASPTDICSLDSSLCMDSVDQPINTIHSGHLASQSDPHCGIGAKTDLSAESAPPLELDQQPTGDVTPSTNSDITSDSGEHLGGNDARTSVVTYNDSSTDRLMDNVSENRTEGCDSPTENTRSLRRCRKRALLDGDSHCCPVCGTSLRQGELSTHLTAEVEKLNRLSRCGRKVSQDGLTSSHGKKSRIVTGKNDSLSAVNSSKSRYEMFQRIQSERQTRMAARHKKASETRCPVCNKCILGSPSDLILHVDQCLMNKGDDEEDCVVDIDGEDEEDASYEEYTWAGQTRVRVTTMLEGGLAGSGFKCATKDEDEDEDLNVDGDESEMFGRRQYSEGDLIPCCSDEPAEERARKALRKAVLRNENGSTSTPRENGSPSASEVPPQNECNTSNHPDNTVLNNCQVDTTEVIASLKARIQQDVAQLIKSSVPKCLICMEMYAKPLTSIQCWHVHCEDCWLRTLGAKKLCPQCNMITSPTDLRRIYL